MGRSRRWIVSVVFLAGSCATPNHYTPPPDGAEQEDGGIDSIADGPGVGVVPDATADTSVAVDEHPAIDAHTRVSIDGGSPPCTGPSCKAQDGEACSASSDCQSSFCVAGICCKTACTGTCVSCAVADTGKPNGTCAPIQPGHDAPAGQCPSATPASCGNDGKCDGSGRCEKWGPTVVCDDPKCDSTGKLIPQGKCSGSGTCSHDAPSVCPNHLMCKSGACPSNCEGDPECSSGYYCSSNVCDARCKVSVGNLIPNGGFDTAQRWTIDHAQWVRDDALQCSSSGSVRLDDLAGLTSDCFKISPSTSYTFGLRMKGASVGALYCEVDYFVENTCGIATMEPIHHFLPDNALVGRWETAVEPALTPPDAEWAHVNCNTFSGGSGEVDMIFLKRGTGQEF
jgi:hypothetical protein